MSFIVAAVLRLVKDDRLNLDTPIKDDLRPESVALSKKGGYDPWRITNKSLLQHTSGIFDFATSDVFLGRVFSDPQHRWTRTEQLSLAMDNGKAYGGPGEVYKYGDTGCILLGEIIEVTMGKTMAVAIHDLEAFDHLGCMTLGSKRSNPFPSAHLAVRIKT